MFNTRKIAETYTHTHTHTHVKAAKRNQIFLDNSGGFQILNNKSECGRSMLEMLAVLAIIGVLSIAGILGYQMAMAQYKANEIWNDVLLRAQAVRSINGYDSKSEAEEVLFESLGTVGRAGYVIDGEIGEPDTIGAFWIRVSDVPANVCERVIQMRPESLLAIWPNGYLSTKCDGRENEMYFVFDAPRMCSNMCHIGYNLWIKNCETEWKAVCSKRLGFFCEQERVVDNRCQGGYAYHCYASDYDSLEDPWTNNDPPVVVCP